MQANKSFFLLNIILFSVFLINTSAKAAGNTPPANNNPGMTITSPAKLPWNTETIADVVEGAGDGVVNIDVVKKVLRLIIKEEYLPTLFIIRFDRLKSVITADFFANLQGLKEAMNHNAVDHKQFLNNTFDRYPLN